MMDMRARVRRVDGELLKGDGEALNGNTDVKW